MNLFKHFRYPDDIGASDLRATRMTFTVYFPEAA